jgi:hypothetical protein
MSNTLSVDEVADQLAGRIGEISVPEPALGVGSLGQAAATMVASQVTGSILSIIAQFLADNSDLLPPKDAVLSAVNKAIDAALAKIDRPILTSLISRSIKAAIAKAVDSLYDAILNPQPPTTEV